MTTEPTPEGTELRIGKMNRVVATLLALLFITSAAVGVYLWQQRPVDKHPATTVSQNQAATARTEAQDHQLGEIVTSTKGVAVVIYSPLKNAQISNPVGAIGEVPGDWSFEAAFPVELVDSTGATVAHGSASVLGDWTTSHLVPFSVQLIYADAPKGTGTLVLHSDNESGLAKSDDEVRIPVRF